MVRARIHVIDSQGVRAVAINKPTFLIGRSASADLHFTVPDVSREHAEIIERHGQFVLRDRSSRYGTFVSGEQISERVLKHGDRIRLGRTEAIELIFVVEGAETIGLLDAGSEMSLIQISAILNGLRALGSGRMLDEVLALAIDSALEVTKTERGFIMLANPRGELEFKVARGRERTILPGTTFETSQKIPRHVFRTGESLMVPDLAAIDGEHEETVRMGIRQVLCVPLRVTPMSIQGGSRDWRLIGVLYLDSRSASKSLSQARSSSLEAFATQAALAIESARLYAESDEKARIDRDLQIAAEIQRALLPEPLFANAVVELAAASVPCRTVGGDFYDYFDVGGHGFGFALGDVAGKGPAAALLAATVQANFAALAPLIVDPARAMDRMNRALLRRAVQARFATMYYGIVTVDGRLHYCNCGQEPPIVVGRSGTQWLRTGGPVLGLLPEASYECGTIALDLGDVIVVVSDGVTEARNRSEEEFGRDRLVEAMHGQHGVKPDVVLERLLAAVREFSQGAPQADDLTALVLRYRAGR
jgi:phosphoserine phosphatase RsbU/P